MRHTTWLQNRTPTCALAGKTPYEMKINKKPHLAGLQEFGVAAYVKDLKAGKLDARAQLGRFVGYDSESKGYRIYWPEKCSVTVECNIVFNENDVFLTKDYATIPGDVLAEGRKKKSSSTQETMPKTLKNLTFKRPVILSSNMNQSINIMNLNPLTQSLSHPSLKLWSNPNRKPQMIANPSNMVMANAQESL